MTSKAGIRKIIATVLLALALGGAAAAVTAEPAAASRWVAR